MSARTKKTTTTTVTSTSTKSTGNATPSRASIGTPGRAGGTPGRVTGTPGSASSRPPSPTMISRLAEKNELASLNDRLASYIDRVRQLEGENSRLTRIIQTQEDSVSKETVNLKGMYDAELMSARKLLDEMAKDKAKLQFENGSLKSELEDLKERLRQREKELSASDKRVLAAEAQVHDLQAKLSDALNQRRFYEDEYNKLQKDHEAVNKNLSNVKKLLEEETINRVDLENRLQSLREELAFKKQLHEQELNESVHRSRVVYEETDTRLQQDYDSRLREALNEMRQENEDQLRAMREETEMNLEKKLTDMRDQVSRSEGERERNLSELRSSRKRIDELTAEISRLTSLNGGYESRIRDLENQLKRLNEENQATSDSLNAEIRRLRASLEDQLQEYRDLMDVKIQLDIEISAYRKLLESEETRLQISTSVDSGTPGRSAAGESSRKRKRVEESSLLQRSKDGNGLAGSYSSVVDSSKAEYSIKRKMVESVEVSEVCREGKFIRLYNLSEDKDVPLGGWQLKQQCGESEATYKFPRSTVLKALQYITVWSSDTEQTHSPPTDYVMKGQVWCVADHMITTLLDNKGEEQASCEMEKTQVHDSCTKFYSGNGNGADLDSSSAEGRKSKWSWSLFGATN